MMSLPRASPLRLVPVSRDLKTMLVGLKLAAPQ
jgi:hypothetical protein